MNRNGTIALILGFGILVSLACAENLPLQGGPCEYEAHKGQAKIVSIIPKNKSGTIQREIFEVKFIFTYEQDPEETFAKTEGKIFVLLLANSSYPSARFLEKYDIHVGKVFKCYAKVITRGTCTPIIFEFPTIELDDYSRK